MEETRWLRLVTIGIVLGAMAVGYFLLAQRFSSSKTQVIETKSEIVVATPLPLPTPTVLGLKPATASAQAKAGLQVKSLPATGFPGTLLFVFSAGALAAGYGLRKFPN